MSYLMRKSMKGKSITVAKTTKTVVIFATFLISDYGRVTAGCSQLITRCCRSVLQQVGLLLHFFQRLQDHFGTRTRLMGIFTQMTTPSSRTR